MNIKQRVKDILTNPLMTWQNIMYESTSSAYLVNQYLLPLLLLGSFATFLGFGLIGINSSIQQGLTMAVNYFITNSAGIVFVTAAVTKLAPYFSSTANFNSSLKLIVYSFTPALIGSILNIMPSLTWLNTIFSLYGIYLLYLGMPLLLGTSEDKRGVLTLLIIVCTLLIYNLLSRIISSLLLLGFGVNQL